MTDQRIAQGATPKETSEVGIGIATPIGSHSMRLEERRASLETRPRHADKKGSPEAQLARGGSSGCTEYRPPFDAEGSVAGGRTGKEEAPPGQCGASKSSFGVNGSVLRGSGVRVCDTRAITWQAARIRAELIIHGRIQAALRSAEVACLTSSICSSIAS